MTKVNVTLNGRTFRNLSVEWGEYPAGGAEGLILWDEKECKCFAVVSVNLVESGLVPPKGFVYVKTWGENEGIFEQLVAQGILEDTGESEEVNQWGSEAVLAKILKR